MGTIFNRKKVLTVYIWLNFFNVQPSTKYQWVFVNSSKHVKHTSKDSEIFTSKIKTAARGKFLVFKCKYSSAQFVPVFNFHHCFQSFFLCHTLLPFCHLFSISCFPSLSTKDKKKNQPFW